MEAVRRWVGEEAGEREEEHRRRERWQGRRRGICSVFCELCALPLVRTGVVVVVHRVVQRVLVRARATR